MVLDEVKETCNQKLKSDSE